jgi:BlaI family penicillinase repressor
MGLRISLTRRAPNATRCNATMTSIQKKRPKGLGEVEQIVMDYVWGNGPCSAESCREALAAARPMKDSTVRTILRRLEQKGFVTHEIEGRTYIYHAAEARQNVAVRAVKSIIDRFCSGSAEELVIGMVDNAVIDREQLERLARRIARGKVAETGSRNSSAKKED